MIRPRLRPTLSRRIKYLGIAPAAQRKLGKEARRGSHDLRRLVGHAQFLDTLVDNLENDDEAERPEDVISPGPQDVTPSPSKEHDFEDLEDASDSESDGNSDAWSDSSDDEDHALSRTASGRPLVKGASREASPGGESDYFKRPLHDEVARKADALRLHAQASILGGGKRDEDDEDIEIDENGNLSVPLISQGLEVAS